MTQPTHWQQQRPQGALRIVVWGSGGEGRRRLIRQLLPGTEADPSSSVTLLHDDLPGLFTGAATPDLAVILVAAGQGLQQQTRHHSLLAALIGVRHLVVAVDDMDLAGYGQGVFDGIAAEYSQYAAQLDLPPPCFIPISGGRGDNMAQASARMPWYGGLALLPQLQAVELDAAPGPLADAPAEMANQFEATLVWLHDAPLLRGRSYRMQIGSSSVQATVAPLKYRVDIDTLAHVAAETLALDEIGVCELELSRAIPFDAHGVSRERSGFILIDRLSNATVGVGRLHFALRRASNIHWQALAVDKAARRTRNGHGSAVVWLTGLSGAGKSTIADLLEKRLHAQGVHTYLLDGDNVRHGLNKDLGFTAADRVENIRRVAEVARLMVDAGLIVIAAFISPFRAERLMARELMQAGEFIEVHVDTPLAVAEQRDPKGLYRKARRGELANFTGIDSPYEAPEAPELRVQTVGIEPERAVAQIHAALAARGLL